MLNDVRETRNKLMHFRADVDPVERDRLRFCAQWFKYYQPQAAEAGGAAPSVSAPPVESPAGDLQYIGDSAAESVANGTSTESRGSKYAPLASYLSQQHPDLERLALSFGQVEEIIGAELPPAAREHRAWWSNDTTAHVQSAEWLDVNWRVVSINMTTERVVFARARDRERAYIRFFSGVQSRLREVDGFPLVNASPTGQNWIPVGSYPGTGITLVVSFARRKRLRLEFYIDTFEAAGNEALFQELWGRRDVLESAAGTPLEWERLENRRACRVALYTSGSIADDPEILDRLAQWVLEYAPRLDRGLREILASRNAA